jgi:hypothetical protein
VRERKFKDCPKCGKRESMIISVWGWFCLWCRHIEKFNAEEVRESGTETKSE